MQTFTAPEFQFESGVVIHQAPVHYRTWGTLNQAGDNAIIVCHALTGDPHIDDWWGGLLGPGKALDTSRYFIVAANVLGSPYGSASPLTTNTETDQPYGADFPAATIRDTVAIHKLLLEHLGVQQLAMAIGGSMGGMQVLEWGYYGDFVRALVPIAVGGQHTAWCIAWGEAQRQAIFADPKWNKGNYTVGNEPAAGLAAARMMAMISYRSMPSFKERFARNQMHNSAGEEVLSVNSYLQYQGDKLVQRFDANCYVHLTLQMDSHDVARGRGAYPEVLGQLKQPALVVGIESDVLYSLPEQEELAKHMPGASLALLPSIHGHDAFLIELEALNTLVYDWMKDHVVPTNPTKSIAACAS